MFEWVGRKMNRLVNHKTANMVALLLVGSFLIVHIFLIGLFWYYQVTPMVYFNVFSIAMYAVLAIYVARKGIFKSFAAIVYLEVLLHMSVAVCCTGWGSGFQNALIGMSVIIFYSEFIARCLKMPHLKALPFCVLGMFTYIALCTYTHHFGAKYLIPEEVSFWMQVFWGVIVFVVSISLLYIFVYLSAGSYELLSGQAKQDQLTGLHNRYFISDYLEELEKKAGFDDHWIALIDIDDFKKVNDNYGHNCGDVVLKEVACLLQESLVGEMVSRWGGEEFILFGKREANLEEKLDRLRKTIENHACLFGEEKVHITVTLGVSFYQKGQDVRQWIGEADQKMYHGKQQGKNRVVM